MKKGLFAVVALAAIMSNATSALAWGIWGHNHINRGAVLALPRDMGMFFYNHIDFITQESTVPDLRKYTINDKAEFPRHYIELESYHYEGRESMPQTLADAMKKYDKETLDKEGILPWYIQDMMEKLTKAFRNKKKTEILFLAADLGHYIADAHMPLHTTVNRDGQLTGQQGIHSFWESQLPELFGRNYKLYTSDVHYIKDIHNATWDIIDSSHALVHTLLGVEAKLRKDNPEDKQYVMGADGKPARNDFGSPIHSYAYAHVYHELLNGMVERQMRLALEHVADFWYTAWVNAGRPDLSDLDADVTTERSATAYKEDIRAFRNGKVRGCASTKDFPKVQ